MDSQLKTCTKQTDKVFIGPSTTPSVLLPFLLLFQLLRRVKGKGSENIVIYLEEGSHRTSVLWHSKQEGGHVFDCRTRGIAYAHIFVLFFVIWYIIFSLYKTGPRKKNNTTHHLIFMFLFFLFYQNLGRRNYVFAQLLVEECYKCFSFNTVGYKSLTMSSWWTLLFTQVEGFKVQRLYCLWVETHWSGVKVAYIIASTSLDFCSSLCTLVSR